jgi:hypothetical protein
MKTWVLAILLGAIAVAPFLYLAYYMHDVRTRAPIQRQSLAIVDFQPESKPTTIEVGATFTIRAVNVHDGYRFSLDLEGVAHIEAHLPVATKEEAIPVVIGLLNDTTPPPPTVTLLRCVDKSYWIADIQLTMDGERESLVDYLRRKELLLD